MDFYLPEAKLAVQVTSELSKEAQSREIDNLLKLAKLSSTVKQLVIVTRGESSTIEENGTRIDVIPAWKFLLQLPDYAR